MNDDLEDCPIVHIEGVPVTISVDVLHGQFILPGWTEEQEDEWAVARPPGPSREGDDGDGGPA